MFSKGKGKSGHKGGGKAGGKGKGKGKGKDGDLTEERKQELRDGVQTFLESEEMSWALSAELTGLERKFIHELAQENGLQSQSHGFGNERYIQLFKDSFEEEPQEEMLMEEEEETVDPNTIQFSGLKIDGPSRAEILTMGEIEVPDGWVIKARIAMLCKGGLQAAEYDSRDRRSELDQVIETLKKLKPGQHASAKIVSVGQSDTSLAVGLLLSKNIVSTHRTPHITIAKNPEAPQMIASRSVDIMTWTPVNGPTIRGEIIQHPKGPNYVEPAGETRKRPLESDDQSPANEKSLGMPKGMGKAGKGGPKGAKSGPKGARTGKPEPVEQKPEEDTEAADFATSLLNELQEEGAEIEEQVRPATNTAPVVRSRQGNAFQNALNKGAKKGQGKVQALQQKPPMFAQRARQPGQAVPVQRVALQTPKGWEESEEEEADVQPEPETATKNSEEDEFMLSLLGAPGSPQKPAAKPTTTSTQAAKQKSVQAMARTRLGLPAQQQKSATKPVAKKALSFEEELLLM